MSFFFSSPAQQRRFHESITNTPQQLQRKRFKESISNIPSSRSITISVTTSSVRNDDIERNSGDDLNPKDKKGKGGYEGPCSLCRLPIKKGAWVAAIVGLVMGLVFLGGGVAGIHLTKKNRNDKDKAFTAANAIYMYGLVIACKGTAQLLIYSLLAIGIYFGNRVVIVVFAALSGGVIFGQFVGTIIVCVKTHWLVIPLPFYFLIPLDIYLILVALAYADELRLSWIPAPALNSDWPAGDPEAGDKKSQKMVTMAVAEPTPEPISAPPMTKKEPSPPPPEPTSASPVTVTKDNNRVPKPEVKEEGDSAPVATATTTAETSTPQQPVNQANKGPAASKKK